MIMGIIQPLKLGKINPLLTKKLVSAFEAMGWIDNNGIGNSLKKKLDNGELQNLVDQLKAQSGKHVSEDAASILIKNAEYLLGLG